MTYNNAIQSIRPTSSPPSSTSPRRRTSRWNPRAGRCRAKPAVDTGARRDRWDRPGCRSAAASTARGGALLPLRGSLGAGPGASAFVGAASPPAEARPPCGRSDAALHRGGAAQRPDVRPPLRPPLRRLLLLGTAIGGAYGTRGRALGSRSCCTPSSGRRRTSSGASIVLSIHGAGATGKSTALRNVVEEMAIAAGVPPPKVYVIPPRGLNAFAAGGARKRRASPSRPGSSTAEPEELQG